MSIELNGKLYRRETNSGRWQEIWCGVAVELATQMFAVLDEIERLQTIVDPLPKTMDGKTAHVGDVIYYADGSEFVVYSICDSGWEEVDECFLHSSEAYSTREAAEKARSVK